LADITVEIPLRIGVLGGLKEFFESLYQPWFLSSLITMVLFPRVNPAGGHIPLGWETGKLFEVIQDSISQFDTHGWYPWYLPAPP
jgi:hypothetical protein